MSKARKVETGGKGIEKNVKPNDVVPYRPSNSPLENHHGVWMYGLNTMFQTM
ncbi:hypothetical protein J32TS2_26580 [Shouchella clausii]|nr:hypothetical protein J32TS2_26580 [Shouchella clausii]